MYRYLSHRVSIGLKLIVYILIVFVALGYGLSYIYSEISQAVMSRYGVAFDYGYVMTQLSLSHIWIPIVVIIAASIVLVLDTTTFLKRMNLGIKISLEEYKLKEELPHFYTSKTWDQLIKNNVNLMSMYKAFDVMKTARVGMEHSTVKYILDNVSEGIIFIDKHKVVTHVNHVAEKMLGQIPGEALGEVLSRQINDDQLLELIEETFEYDKKIIDVTLDKIALTVSVMPVKDKFGDLIRGIILLKDQPVSIEKKSLDK